MELQNGYKVIFEGKLDTSVEPAVRTFFASKVAGYTEDNSTELTFTNNGGDAVDTKSFKLIYSKDGKLFGSTTGTPTADDVNIVVKAGEDIVFGTTTEAEETEEPEAEEPEAEEEIVEEPTEPVEA